MRLGDYISVVHKNVGIVDSLDNLNVINCVDQVYVSSLKLDNLSSYIIDDINDVDSCLQHMHGLTVTKDMAMDFFWKRRILYTNLFHILFDHVGDSIPV